MIKADFHLHTEDSYDSRIIATELLAQAIREEYQLIAITEHLDLLPQELGAWGLPSLTRYTRRINELKATNPPLELLLGIEIGDYHCHRDFAKRLVDQYDFEIILGSVHFLGDHTNVAIPIHRKMDNAAVQEYYLSNLALVEQCDIDVLAHLGVYKRFYSARPDESFAGAIIKDIFEVMIEREIALELNFSCIRKTYQRLIPEPEQIELYRSLGGSLFTIASDAHFMDHFGDGAHLLPGWLLENAVFSERKSRVLCCPPEAK
ncbi:MAG TPA: histidinol-phosphatase HisJ family protein [Candidatus Cloacimonadota bacterium]|nr:histidinol-phosphatase HisJ family protein [Candidatus Cloacimonadota bacterium]